jgi:predicted GH43/DUF377 family glycosyl hydrolase
VIRVYYAARNAQGKSYPVYFDVARSNPMHIVNRSDQPIMNYGAPGTFDDEGIMPACIVEQEDAIWIYYSGWNQRVSVPYHNSTGLAVSHDGGDNFTRMFEGPILDRTPTEPYLAVTPSVVKENGLWHIWYISGLRWQKIGEKYEPVYVIKYASSPDGIHWQRDNIQCIAQNHPLEAFSHPSVIKRDDTYHMWFCYRHSEDYRDGKRSYRIGYATSTDGKNWHRNDAESGLNASGEEWDSLMQCYPYVFEVDKKTYMFYNGNGFGQAGIGLAELVAW